MIAARGHATAAGVLIPEHGRPEIQRERKKKQPSPLSSAPDVEPTPAERIARFRANASETAFQLACYLAVVELTMPIMRLVQQAMLPASRQIHLAEVYLGGLLFHHPQNVVNPLNPEEVVYDFYRGKNDQDPGIRDLLLEITPKSHVERVRDEMSMLIEGRLAQSDEFRVLISLPGAQTGRQVDTARKPFSWISQAALRRLGYEPGPPPLPVFTFETVTLDQYGKEIKREEGEATYFREELSPEAHLDMVQIEGGKFMMGSPENEADRFGDEGPQHEVNVPDFFIGKYAVTQAQWKVVAGWEKVEIELKPDPSNFKGENRPVENISWDEAKEFCKRLAKKTGREYRLPTEAEWEYACRAGTDTPFAFGETITPDYVNYDGNNPYAKAPKGIWRMETVDVGSLGVANGWGLYDMHGNVWEWCEDLWHGNYEGAPRDGSAWLSGGDSSMRVVRGGSFGNDAWYCRSAYRLDFVPDYRGHDLGFRVVCVSARTNGP
ncbi:MAG: formylglycine-generating enzyme family protein [Acidobacteriota bacterium]|nr:MAG: formylglycine-generating enzyme family protein [Acidobacteriota bacterium]